MLPSTLVGITILFGLIEAVTSRSTDLSINMNNLQNMKNSMPIRSNNPSTREDYENDMEKYESLYDSLKFIQNLPNRDLKPLNKLSIIDELGGNNNNADEINPIVQVSEDEGNDDNDIDQLSEFLNQLLQEPGGWESPIVLIDEPIVQFEESFPDNDNSIDDAGSELINKPWKRSRYYRRYPWKRQNSRSHYDDGSRYLCTPTREDVFQLLQALHNARQGNKSKTVNFCNRRRPAGAVFTNIRFLGRRK